MIRITGLTLENEMDVVLAHRRTMRMGEKLKLTIATQTTFATAVAEIARSVVEHTDDGVLDVGLEQSKQRYALKAEISFSADVHFTNADEGFYYAQKLIPDLNQNKTEKGNLIVIQLGLPRSLRLDPVKVAALKKDFDEEPPVNAYEEIKQRNIALKGITAEQEEALRQSKIIDAQKTEFISIASHEFKTPITVLKAYTQIAKRLPKTGNEKLTEIIDKIDIQTTKLARLVQQMLDVSKMESGTLQYNMQVVNVNMFITEAVDMIRHILPDHEVSLTLSDEVSIHADKERLEQVFSNLLANAAKYSQKNTLIAVNCELNNDGIKITVKDQGIGISAESLKLVFEKFYRDKSIKESHPGLGMGLYVTSKIIKDHGGDIWVESEPEKGSSFIFTLPVYTEAVEEIN
jgi:signal transduction histidine kinase